MMDFLPIIVALSLFGLGILGTFLPILPGAILIWLGMFIYGFLTNFENLSVGFYIIQGLATILVTAVDYIATAVGTKRFKGSKASIWGASLGLFVGVILMGPLGIIFGPFLGALGGEMLVSRSIEKSISASIGAVIGILGGLFVKLGIEAVMIVWFFIRI